MVNTRGSEQKEREESADRVLKGTDETPEKDTPTSGKKSRMKMVVSRPKRTKPASTSDLQEPKLIKPKDTWKKDQKVNVFCKTKILTILHQKMKEPQRKCLSRSFLNNFWELPTGKFPTQLLLQIIRRRVHNDNKNVLTFKLSGHAMDFTLKDFAIITGLNCDNVKFTKLDALPPAQIDKSFYKKHGSQNLKALIGELEDYDFSNDKLSVKVAKLAMLESIVIPKQHTNNFDELHLRIVENDIMFEKYPWGRVSFDLLRESVSKAVGSCDSQCMTISGFAYALIYWAFEVIPGLSLGEKYGRRINNEEPRILNWDVMRLGTSKELEKDVFNDQMVVADMLPIKEVGKYSYMAEFEKNRDSKGKGVARDIGMEFDDVSEGLASKRDVTGDGNVGAESSGKKTEIQELKEIIVAGFAALSEKMDCIVDILYMRQMRTGGPSGVNTSKRPVEEVREGDETHTHAEHEPNESVSDNQVYKIYKCLKFTTMYNKFTNLNKENEDLVRAAGSGEKVDACQQKNDEMDMAVDVEALKESLESIEEMVDSFIKDILPEGGEGDVESVGAKQDGGTTVVETSELVKGDDGAGVQSVGEKKVEDTLEAANLQGDVQSVGAREDRLDSAPTVVGASELVKGDDGAGVGEKNVQISVAERGGRLRNVGHQMKEPYTTEFGSADQTTEKVPRKRRTETAGRGRGRRKKLKETDVAPPSVHGQAIDQAPPGSQPSFYLGLTPEMKKNGGGGDVGQ